MKLPNNYILVIFSAILLGFFTTSCDDDSDPTDPNNPTTVETWTLNLSTDSEIPTITDRTETGTVTLTLLSDNTLTYAIDVDNLMSGDELNAAHIHEGMPSENGDVVKGLVASASEFDSEGRANGVVTLTQAQVDALMEANMHYVNVHSAMMPSGLLRANIGDEIEWSYDVMLDMDRDDNGASGMTYLRKSGNTLYYNIELEGIGTNDTLTAAHIHEGAMGTNGAPFITLYSSSIFTPEMVTLDSDQENKLLTDPIYVNVHTSEYSAGVVRGQIR